MVVVEAVPYLVLTDCVQDVRGLRLNLPVVAAIARFVESDAAGDQARRHSSIAYFPRIYRGGLENIVEGATQGRFDEKMRIHHA
jgi:hypothetical protein